MRWTRTPSDALPPAVREAVYARMWGVLSGKATAAKSARLAAADRRAIVDILRDTRNDLPAYSDSMRG